MARVEVGAAPHAAVREDTSTSCLTTIIRRHPLRPPSGAPLGWALLGGRCYCAEEEGFTLSEPDASPETRGPVPLFGTPGGVIPRVVSEGEDQVDSLQFEDRIPRLRTCSPEPCMLPSSRRPKPCLS